MWRARPKAESENIGRFWDARVTLGSAQSNTAASVHIDASLAETISRLEHLDNSRSASADFSRQFEQQFLAAVGGSPVQPAPPIAGTLNGPVRDQRTDAKGSLIEFPVGRVRRPILLTSIATSVAAALLLFIVAAASWYFLVERRDSLPDADNADVIPARTFDFGVPMDRGNPARSGVLPGPGVSSNLEARWTFEAGRGGISAPALVGDTIYVASGSEPETGTESRGSVIAIDAATGTERWRFPAENTVSGTPAVAAGILYAADTGGVVYAIDAETGEEIWRQNLNRGWTSPPVVVNDIVYVATAPYRVALNLAVEDGTLVVGSGLVGQASDGVQVTAFDGLSGDEHWQSSNLLSGKPGLQALDAANGDSIWMFEMISLEAGPAISGQRVFAASTFDGTVYALSLSSGDELWQVQTGEALPQSSSPAIAGGSVFITTSYGKIICLDASSGVERWQATAEHISINSSAIVVDDNLFVVDTAFGVSAFSTSDGSMLWSESLKLTGQVVDSPIVSSGNLFIVTSLEGEQGHVAKLWVFAGSDDDDSGEAS